VGPRVRDIDNHWNSLLAELYVVARRSALNIDSLVTSLIDELPDEPNGPF